MRVSPPCYASALRTAPYIESQSRIPYLARQSTLLRANIAAIVIFSPDFFSLRSPSSFCIPFQPLDQSYEY